MVPFVATGVMSASSGGGGSLADAHVGDDPVRDVDDAVAQALPFGVHRDHLPAQGEAGGRGGGRWHQRSRSAAACSAGVSGAAGRAATQDGSSTLR